MTKQPTRAEHHTSRLGLMDDDDIRRWRANVARGSEANADNYWRMLALFLERKDQTPKGLIALSDKELGDLLEDYVAQYEAQSSSTRLVIAAVRSWLARFDRAVKRDIKFNRRTSKPRVDKMHIPTQDELRAILNAADVRARAAISVISFGGQRLEVLGDYTGEDGLVLGDFVDLKIEGSGRVTFTKVPCRVNIRRTLSKKDHEFFTFLGPEACTYIAAYLNERATNEERLAAESPLIIPLQPKRSMDRKERSRKERLVEMGREWNAKRKRENLQPFIRTPNISDLIVKPMRAAGMLDNPAYIWRSYFQSHAEMAAGLSKDWREFMIGHTGDISAEYTTHKRMPEAKIERMREAYEKVLPLIESNHSATLTRVAELEHRLDAMRTAKPEIVTLGDLRERGDVEAKLADAQVDAMTPGELQARARVQELEQRLADALDDNGEQLIEEGNGGNGGNAKATQRIIPKAELAAALAAGARVVTKVDDDSFVIEGGRVLVVGGE